MWPSCIHIMAGALAPQCPIFKMAAVTVTSCIMEWYYDKLKRAPVHDYI